MINLLEIQNDIQVILKKIYKKECLDEILTTIMETETAEESMEIEGESK